MWLALSHIKSSDAGRRVKAIEELAQVSDLKAVLALIGTLADDVPRVRVAAAQAIGRQRDERCVQPLLAALGDPHAGVREAVVDALKNIGHPSVIPYLRPLLRDVAPSVRAHAAHALHLFGWTPRSNEEEVLFHVAAGRFSKAAELGVAAVDALIEQLADESGFKRRAVTEALATINDPRALGAVASRLEDPDLGVRMMALSALGWTGDPAYAPAVLKQLEHEDKNVRACALETLMKIRGADLFPILTRALEDPHWNVRAVAAAAFGALGDPRAIGPLTKALQEADGDVRQIVAEAIGRLKDENAIESLILAQLDSNSAVRQATRAALFQIDPQWEKSDAARRTLPPLKRALKHDDYGVRQTAADLLNRIFNIRQCEPALLADVDAETARRQRAVDVLASVLWDDDGLIRFAGVWALHQIGESRAAGPVSTKLKDGEPCVRRAAERAMVDFGVTENSRRYEGHVFQATEDWGHGPVA
jgi:HEAT repeat protein